MHQRDEGALAIRDISREQHIGSSRLTSNTVDEIVESLACLGREQHGLGIATTEARSINTIEQIDFIEHRKRQTLAGTDLVKNAIDCLELALVVLVGGINNFKDQVGTKDLGQRGLKGINETMR